MRNNVKEGYKLGGHELNFKPAKTVPRPVKADFEHMKDYNEIKINRKGPEGVITEPKNFLTNPPKKGIVGKGTFLGGKIEYIEDPFNRRKELAKKEREEHEKKMQEKPFS